MARTAKPAIDRLKETILNDLSPEDQVTLGVWFEAVLEVREADSEAAKKREARKAATAANDAPPVEPKP